MRGRRFSFDQSTRLAAGLEPKVLFQKDSPHLKLGPPFHCDAMNLTCIYLTFWMEVWFHKRVRLCENTIRSSIELFAFGGVDMTFCDGFHCENCTYVELNVDSQQPGS